MLSPQYLLPVHTELVVDLFAGGGGAELLCDYRLGWERLRTKMRQEAPNLAVLPGHSVPLRYRQVHTCDTPLCHACAKHSGPIFICLRGAAGFRDFWTAGAIAAPALGGKCQNTLAKARAERRASAAFLNLENLGIKHDHH